MTDYIARKVSKNRFYGGLAVTLMLIFMGLEGPARSAPTPFVPDCDVPACEQGSEGAALGNFLNWSAADGIAAPKQNRDDELQATLEAELRAEGWSDLVEKKRLAVGLIDLTQTGVSYYAGVNDDHMLYAASLPKIAILLTAIEAMEQGRLGDTPEMNKRLSRMIKQSDNGEASRAFDSVGADAIASMMTHPKYGLYTAPLGGLWAGRGYRRDGTPTMRDPISNLSHGATARQVTRFYALLDARQLVSPYWSERMLDIMGPPAITHKFVAGLRRVPGVRIQARKSGTWSAFHADSALIEHHGKKYVLVGLAETYRGESIMRRLAVIADDIIMNGEHRRDDYL